MSAAAGGATAAARVLGKNAPKAVKAAPQSRGPTKAVIAEEIWDAQLAVKHAKVECVGAARAPPRPWQPEPRRASPPHASPRPPHPAGTKPGGWSASW